MKKVKIEICVGTTCFVMGASQIQALEFDTPEDLVGKFKIVEARCMEYCKDHKDGHRKGPFVRINGEVMADASYDKVLNKIREIIKKEEEK